MSLSSDAAEELRALNSRAAAAGVRYRSYALVTNDQRAMAAIAAYTTHELGGETLDVLDGSLADGSLVGVEPRALLSWAGDRMCDCAPRCLLHVDAVLSPWRATDRHRVWWDQAAMIERSCPLFIPTARWEVTEAPRWARIGSFWIETAQIDVFGPREARHVSEFIREIHR